MFHFEGSVFDFIRIVISVLIVVVIASTWRVFMKAGKPGWAALVPIYNQIIRLEIAEKPIYWIVYLIIPVVNVIVTIIVSIGIAKRFKKNNGFGIGLALLPFIFYPILALADDAIIVKKYWGIGWVKSICIGVILLMTAGGAYLVLNQKKVPASAPLFDSSYAMYEAVEKDDAEYVKLHLHDGHNWITYSDEHEGGVGTLLHFAANIGSPRVVTALLDAGASPMFKDNQSRTALGLAIQLGHRDVIEIMFARNDYDVNLPDGDTSPLHIAARVDDVKTTRLLLKKGARVNAKDEDGHTPLRVARTCNNSLEAQILVENGGEE